MSESGSRHSLETGVVVARYYYILHEILRLNRETHQLFSAFVAIVTLLGTGAASLFVSWKSLGLNTGAVIVVQYIIASLITFVSVATIMLLLSNVFSWLDYRQEEHDLLTKYGFLFRQPPAVRHIWRWFEFWFALLVLAVAMGSWITLHRFMFPLIQ